MSVGNFFTTKRAALKQRTKSLTTTASLITYTAKTGTASQGFIADEFIRVTTSSGNSMTITVGDGVAYGQELWVLFEVEAATETVDVTTTTGDNGTQLTGAGGYNYFVWAGGTIGWVLVASSAT